MSESKPIDTIYSISGTVGGDVATVVVNSFSSYSVTTGTAGGAVSGNISAIGVTTSIFSSGANTVTENILRSPYFNEPTLGTSSISVYQVAALLEGGNSVSSLVREFPSLSRDEIKAARDYATRFPNPAARHPTKTLKDFVFNTDLYKLEDRAK